LIVPFALLLGIAPLVRWKQDKLANFITKPLIVIATSITLSLIWLVVEFPEIKALALLGVTLFIWIMLFTALELKQTLSKVSFSKLPLSHFSMVLGHIGVAFLIAGVALTSQYSVERDVKMNTGDSAELKGYEFKFNHVENIDGPNYDGWAAVITITKQDEFVTKLLAEKRFYAVQRNTMTEAAIDAGFFRDIYISLGERLPDGAWALRIYVKPYIRWIWLGGIIVAFAGLLTLFDRRYRTSKNAKQG
jgi:cytochrome c-type biogenesis protein CcmF